jgi:hypothetical protein
MLVYDENAFCSSDLDMAFQENDPVAVLERGPLRWPVGRISDVHRWPDLGVRQSPPATNHLPTRSDGS